ncbi:MAG TPA: lipid-binding SYLF domain-containing protein [Vicinamibacterales bacterium]|nr:lipid-binding SYLF domain-containing protein [Vicinamibacterales bacterium]
MAAVALGAASSARADISTGETNRLREASTVVRELRDTPDKGIADDLWTKAECVVVIPSMKKAALGLGGEYGRGVMSCRRGADWSAPIFMTLTKGSWGLQIGFEETDLVLLVMNQRGVEKLLNNKVSLGADASAAAGPVGRTGAAATDGQFSAEILTYSRARGVFAGIDLSGGVLKPDDDANADVYGKGKTAKAIIADATAVPAEARPFVQSLSVTATSGKK